MYSAEYIIADRLYLTAGAKSLSPGRKDPGKILLLLFESVLKRYAAIEYKCIRGAVLVNAEISKTHELIAHRTLRALD